MLFATIIGTSVTLFVCMLLVIGILVSAVSIVSLGTSDSITAVPSSAILKIDLSQPISERGNTEPFANISSLSFNPVPESTPLLNALLAIEKAATDPSIKFIYMNLSTMNISIAQLEELRGAIENFRKSGKAVIAYANNYSQGAYYLASAADKIYIQKEGNSQFIGIGMNMMFFKDILDKIGLDVQLIRHGKFKAAAEQFVSNRISETNKEQNMAIIKSIWNTWLSDISESREISVEELDFLADNLKISNSTSMVENRFADEAVTMPEMSEKLCSLFGVENEKDLEMISLNQYVKAVIKPNIKAKDKIAVIYAEGEITMNGPEGITANEYCPIISKIKADSSVKAVVLRVNSPGGDAQAAEMINTELQLLRKEKPVIVSFGENAASGGYWIAAQSDYIFTDRTTLTGSIGVFSLALNYGKGLKKHLDINVESLATNRHSNMSSGINPLDNTEQQYMQNLVGEVYSNFIEIVADGRGLDSEYTESIAQGRIWSGTDAVNIRLADKTGSIADAIQYAAVFSGLSDYHITEYPAVKSPVDKFLEMVSNSSSVKAFILPEPLSSIEKTYSQLSSQKGIRTYARLPYAYELQY